MDTANIRNRMTFHECNQDARWVEHTLTMGQQEQLIIIHFSGLPLAIENTRHMQALPMPLPPKIPSQRMSEHIYCSFRKWRRAPNERAFSASERVENYRKFLHYNSTKQAITKEKVKKKKNQQQLFAEDEHRTDVLVLCSQFCFVTRLFIFFVPFVFVLHFLENPLWSQYFVLENSFALLFSFDIVSLTIHLQPHIHRVCFLFDDVWLGLCCLSFCSPAIEFLCFVQMCSTSVSLLLTIWERKEN